MGGTGWSRFPGAPRNPAGGRASRAAAKVRRARRSGCQPLSTASSASCQDAPAAGRPHSGAKAMLLGAVSLLRLIGLLHLGCPGSSPSGLGDGLSVPLKAHNAPGARKRTARRRPADDMSRSRGCQTADTSPCWPRRASPEARAASRTDTPGEYARIALRQPSGRCYPLRALGAGDVRRDPQEARPGSSGTSSAGATSASARRARTPGSRFPTVVNATHHPTDRSAGSHRRMDAKQVWRAALGELQVSLSPANFETWLRDTQLVDVDEQRFRIAVPNGFAKDWLESRYRSLISQTLARIVGYSVQVEFVIGTDRRRSTPGRPSLRRPATATARAMAPAAARVLRPRSGSSRPASAARAGRPTSTRATRSRTSSSGRPTASPTRPACRSRSARATPTTRSSCTAGSASARPT